jgi:hypothetical protein
MNELGPKFDRKAAANTRDGKNAAANPVPGLQQSQVQALFR